MQNQQTNALLQNAQPLVSFVVTYYDLPVQLLCQCIDSILALDLTPNEREIILVDDGSPTSPMNGLMHYGDDILYVRQKNGGLSSARNKGIEVATGRYIQFVDADDHLVVTDYNLCLDLLRQHIGIDMVLFNFADGADNQPAPTEPRLMNGTEYMRHHNIHGSACSYLFRTKTLSELRFTPGIYHEDEEFTPQLLIRSEQVCITNARAYYYNHRAGSITTGADNEQVQKRLDDCHHVITRLHQQTDRLPQTDRLALQRRVSQLTMDYLYQTIVQTRSAQQLNQRIAELRSEGLFPLPKRDYSQKYNWFRTLSNSSIGRSMLLRILPFMKRER